MMVTRLGLLLVTLTAMTGLSWMMASEGVGLSDDFKQTASVRAGSAGGSRVLVGGGIHSGK